MTDALDGMKAAFDALAVSPASTFTSFRGYQRRVDTGSGKTANRFVFFRLGEGDFGVEGASNGVEFVDGQVLVIATLPLPSVSTDAIQDMPYDVIRQFDDALTAATPSRQFTANSRRYHVKSMVEHGPILAVTGWPWAAGQDWLTMTATFAVEYIGA